MSRGCGLTEEELEDVQARERASNCGADGNVVSSAEAQGGSWHRGGTTQGAAVRPNAKCVRCRTAEAEMLVRQNEPYCTPCVLDGVASKVRVALKDILKTGDTILVAVSGGASSLSLLQCLVQLQAVNAAARKETNRATFSIEAVHIVEPALAANSAATKEQVATSSSGGGAADSDVLETLHEQQQQQRAAVASTGFTGTLHVWPLANVFAELSEASQREAQLTALLLAVPDITAREDLVSHLRNRLLLQGAARLGCSKVARGDSATARAVRVVADTVKGRGFSLPADLAPVDLRWGGARPLVLLPAAEVTAKELAVMAQALGLGCVADRAAAPRQGLSLNTLSKAFLESMQANVPSTTQTILRATSHFEPFPWMPPPPVAGTPPRRSAPPQTAASAPETTSVGASQMPVISPSASTPADSCRLDSWPALCGVCDAPLPVSLSEDVTCSGTAALRCCGSCSRQIIGDTDDGSRFACRAGTGASPVSLLPEAMRQYLLT